MTKILTMTTRGRRLARWLPARSRRRRQQPLLRAAKKALRWVVAEKTCTYVDTPCRKFTISTFEFNFQIYLNLFNLFNRQVEVVARDLSGLTSDEKLAAIGGDAPELLALLADLKDSLAEVRFHVPNCVL